MSNPIKICLVEDDVELSQMVVEFLTSEGFDVVPIYEGTDAVESILRLSPDLVILDIMLPGVDGVEICRQLRPNFSRPIIMLTAKDDDLVEVASLQQGADNYLSKPIRPHVLLAHITATIRRESSPEFQRSADQLIVQDLVLDKESFSVTQGDNTISFTTAEFELIVLLAESAGIPVSRDILYEKLRGFEYDGLDRTIDLRISAIRKKLNDESAPYKYIKTVRGKGYILSRR